MVILMEGHLFQADVRTDKASELLGAYLSKTLEAGDLRVRT